MKGAGQGGYVGWALVILLGWVLGQAGGPPDARAQLPAGNPPPAAPPDTLQAAIVVPEGLSAPVNVSVVPDSLMFGGLAFALLEWPAAEAAPAVEEVSFSVDWLALAESEAVGRLQSAWLSEAPDQRLVVPFRIYQTAAFRLLAGPDSPWG